MDWLIDGCELMIPNERLAYWVKGQGEMRDDNDFLMMVLKGTPFAFHVKCFEGEKELCRERKEAQEDTSLMRTIGPPHNQQNNMTLQGLTPCSVHILTTILYNAMIWKKNKQTKNGYTTVWWNSFYFTYMLVIKFE